MPIALGAGQRKLDRMMGEQIRWWQAQKCACVDPKRGTADKSHAQCGGTGVYRVERDCSKFLAIIANFTTMRQFNDMGQLQSGDLVCSTWPDEIPLADDDWISVLSREATAKCLLTRGTGATDAIPVALTPVSVIENVAGTGGDILTDWQQQGDTILWAGSIAAGTQYSVRLRYFPKWLVVSAGTVIRRPDPGNKRLPRRVGLTLIPEARPVEAY